MIFLAHITEEIAYQNDFVLLCKKAVNLNQPMYVIIKEGVDWSKFKQFPWRKKYFYHHDFEVKIALSEILDDYQSCFAENPYGFQGR
ncbi:MAG: hypothetical protein KGY67_00675 [Candidatus Thermoplasmatota archaeon]|nr:hypothetical protein [Candidatus Thermoplasmatota archaeon]